MSVALSRGSCAVVPVKNMENAKKRLSPVLTSNERYRLFRAMLEDVLTTLVRTSALARVVLVTRDDEVVSIARDFGVDTLKESENRGQTEAVNFAITQLMSGGVTSLLAVPADIPLVSPPDIEAVVAAHALEPAITIAPARDELGSNAILCSPPNALSLRFGDNSFHPHVARARQAGIEPTIVKRSGLGLDIDVPSDLVELCTQPSMTRSYSYLRESGIAKRLVETPH